MALPIETKTFLQLSFSHLCVAYDWCHKVFCCFLVMVFCCFSDMKKGVGRNSFPTYAISITCCCCLIYSGLFHEDYVENVEYIWRVKIINDK